MPVDSSPVSLDSSEAALLLIDLQNGFVHPDGMTARIEGSLPDGFPAAVEACGTALAAARAAGLPVIHTQHQMQPGYVDGGFLVQELYPKLCAQVGREMSFELVAGTWEAQFYEPVAPVEGEHVVTKNRFDAFIGTTLEQVLTRLKVRTLIVGGVATSVCVESTVRHASMCDYRIHLMADAVADVDPVANPGAIGRMAALFAHVISVQDLCATLDSVVPARRIEPMTSRVTGFDPPRRPSAGSPRSTSAATKGSAARTQKAPR